MDDSMINPILLSSSVHLENVEQLIKNLEKQTVHMDHFEDILSNRNKQDIITKSFSSLSSSTMAVDDIADDNFLMKSITFTNDAEHFSVDSLLTPHDLFENNQLKKQQTLPTNDQSLINDQDGGFTWDDQYDTRANYRLTFSTEKQQKIDPKSKKSRRHKHRSTDQKTNSTYSEDGMPTNVANNMNDWSMRSSFNTLEQSIEKPTSSEQQVPNNNSPGSSAASSLSSTSWRRMKESQRTTSRTETKEPRPPSPFSLYKIFQQKSNLAVSLSRSASQFSRQQNDAIVPNHQKIQYPIDKSSLKSHRNTDQAIQTSLLLDSSSNSNINQIGTAKTPKYESYAHLTVPSLTPMSSKSLPDLSFISQYSKELPRSRATSPSTSSISVTRTTPSPILIQQQKQDSERPRTLKSIKRYKNSKHSTEPLGFFYSPQLRKTFAAVPASAVIAGSNITSRVIKMKLPPSSSPQLQLKSCLKYGPRANSCDIQAMLQDRKSPVPSLSITESASTKDSTSPSSKRRCSEADVLKLADNQWSSNIIQNLSREHRSEYDLTLMLEQNAAKKSVSFSENISQHLISPCNPTSTFNDLAMVLHGNKERSTIRYGEMRRCQTDIIVVDSVLHLHSFTESPPNEFRLQETDCLNDDQSLMNQSYVNIIPNLDEPGRTTTIDPLLNPATTVSNEKNITNQPAISNSLHMNTSTTILDQSLDCLLERIHDVIKHLFEIKRSDKAFFLNNEHNTQLDFLLRNDLCTAIQNILEHGIKSQRKSLWRIIETSVDHGQVPRAYYEAKQIAQNASSHWLYKFQAFIFALLNKSELINWLYYFTRQKDLIQRYYQSPDALILVAISSTFNLFERIMTQLEKLTPLAFRLTYHAPNVSSITDDPLNTSTMSTHSTKTSARDWVMTISRRTSKNLTQAIVPPTSSNDTFRSTISRKFNAFFTKTNTPSSAVTAKLPENKHQSPATSCRPRLSDVFATPIGTTNKPLVVPSPKLNTNGNLTGRGVSPSVVGAATFQSKIPRPSLNVDKPISARYRSTAPPPK